MNKTYEECPAKGQATYEQLIRSMQKAVVTFNRIVPLYFEKQVN